MTIQTKSITTQTQAAKIWRKVQGTAVDAINFEVEELSLIDRLSNAKLAPSLREVTRPVFVTRDAGVASISEGGYKARPMSPAPQEISVSLVHLQKQFAIAELVLMISRMGGDTQLVKQFKFQLRMATKAMADQVGDYFYAGSTGILATTDTDLAGASTVLTLANGFNQSFITNAAYLANLFKSTGGVTGAAGDFVRGRDATSSYAQIANAIGQVTSKSLTNGTITVTWSGSAPSFTTNGIAIVKANSLDDTADDYNKAFVGLTEILTATSLHGLSGATFPDWAVALADTTGGRLDGTRIEKAADAVEDASGRTVDTIIWSKGVKRDVKAQYKAAVMFNDAYAIPIDGNVKAKGISFFASRRVPPGMAIPFAKAALEKFFWKPDLDDGDGSMTESELLESEDIAARIGRIDLVGNLVTNQRNAFSYFSGLTES
jgi:hypothetical protein